MEVFRNLAKNMKKGCQENAVSGEGAFFIKIRERAALKSDYKWFRIQTI